MTYYCNSVHLKYGGFCVYYHVVEQGFNLLNFKIPQLYHDKIWKFYDLLIPNLAKAMGLLYEHRNISRNNTNLCWTEWHFKNIFMIYDSFADFHDSSRPGNWPFILHEFFQVFNNYMNSGMIIVSTEWCWHETVSESYVITVLNCYFLQYSCSSNQITYS